MTDDALFRMQQEAYERVRRREEETRRLVKEQPLRAPSAREVRLRHERSFAPASPGTPPRSRTDPLPPRVPGRRENPPGKRCPPPGKRCLPFSFFTDMESDRLLTLMLALLLLTNGAQPEVILALLYIAAGD
ncbi:MAG: hypothetical protein ACI39E_02420 [Acutalibacteraceae bacterium]